eukprot:3031617-Alexandrium_andersonii.AAC.1
MRPPPGPPPSGEARPPPGPGGGAGPHSTCCTGCPSCQSGLQPLPFGGDLPRGRPPRRADRRLGRAGTRAVPPGYADRACSLLHAESGDAPCEAPGPAVPTPGQGGEAEAGGGAQDPQGGARQAPPGP